MQKIKKILKNIIKILEPLILPAVFLSGIILKSYRNIGSRNLPLSTIILKKIGIFPIADHYYEPRFIYSNKKKTNRNLPGILFESTNQLKLLKKLNYQEEFNRFLLNQENANNKLSFSLNNNNFAAGDAEFLFNIIRHLKPSKIIEIGCGESTKIINFALKSNNKESVNSQHICIEPYEQPWLEKYKNINLIRSKVEDCNIDWKNDLKERDILFIDSSHIIRPDGDVLFEYLTILPQLQSGVIVHIHDIFTPNNYPNDWMQKDVVFFNEQYLLEALLENKTRYQVYASLNYLKHKHFYDLKKVCTFIDDNTEPGSFYIKIK